MNVFSFIASPIQTFRKWNIARKDHYFEERYKGKLVHMDRIKPMLELMGEHKDIEWSAKMHTKIDKIVSILNQQHFLEIKVWEAKYNLAIREKELMEQGHDDIEKLRLDTIALRKELMGVSSSVKVESELINLAIGRFNGQIDRINTYIGGMDKTMVECDPMEQRVLGNDALLKHIAFDDLELYNRTRAQILEQEEEKECSSNSKKKDRKSVV